MAYPDFADLRAGGVLQDVAAFSSISLAYESGGQAEAIAGELVTGNFFDVLGVRIAPGRAFLAEEDRRGSPVRVAIISHAFWTDRLNANPAVAGTPITLNGSAYTIVGVAPAQFVGTVVGRAPEVWVPMAMQQEAATADRWSPTEPRQRGSARRARPSLAERGWASEARSDIDADACRARRCRQAAASLRIRTRTRPAAFNAVPLGEGPGVRASSRPLLRLLGGVGRARAAHRLRQRRQPAPRPQRLPPSRGGGTNGGRRRSFAPRAPVVDRVGAAVAVRRPWRRRPRQLGGSPAARRRHSGSCRPRHERASPRVSPLRSPPEAESSSASRRLLQTLQTNTISALRDEGGAVATGASPPACVGRSSCSRSR